MCKFKYIKNIFIGQALFLVLLFFAGCENNLEKINAITEGDQFPLLSGKDAQIIFSDSARIQITINTPELNHYTFSEEPFYEFPQGIYVEFYDSIGQVESTIESKYALYYEVQDLWEARDSVVAKNLKDNEALYSEELFWNTQEKRIYSDKFTTITNEDGKFIGENGFEANQNLTRWKLKSTKGSVRVNDEEE